MTASGSSARIVAALVVAAAVVTLSTARAEDAGETSGSFSAAGQAVSVAEDRDTKFYEYRDVPQGAVFEEFNIDWSKPSSAWDFSLSGYNGFRLDELYRVEFGRRDLFRAEAIWDRTPHNLYNDATWLLAGSSGNYTYDPAFRGVIETTAETGPISSLETLMESVLDTSARSLFIGSSRDRAGAAVTFDLSESWDLTVSGQREKREGSARLSTGTYYRTTTAGAVFNKEFFTARGLEMPAPVDYRTTDFGAAASFRRKAGFFTVGWRGSIFSNEIDTLRWDNPFEAPASVSSSSLGLFTGAEQEPSAAQGNTSSAAQRGRLAQGALDLYPDNRWSQAHASGAVNLPGRTRINAGVSVSGFEQNDAFRPYTVNEAICFNAGADNICGTADAGEVLAKDQPLPQSDLQGDIRTTRADFRVTTNFYKPLTLRAAWGMYDYDDRSSELLFPGYAAAGESYFRPGVGQLDALGTRVLFNEPGDYSRADWSVGGVWRITGRVALDFGFGSSTWDYDERQVEKTTEDTVAVKMRATPVDWLAVRATWLDATRDFDGDYEVGFELAGVRAFDVWERDRTRYGLDMDFTPGDAWSFGVAYSNWEDSYPGSVEPITPYEYGLQSAESESISGSVDYSGGRWGLAAVLGHDTSLWESLSVAKTSQTATNYVAENRWIRAQDDTVNWANIHVDCRITEEKVSLFADLTYSRYEGEERTGNPAVPQTNSAQAYSFPGLETNLFSGFVGVTWALNRHLELEGRWWYEPFRIDDFAWDALTPYLQGTVREATTDATTFQDADVSRYLGLDARYSDYTANVVSVLLRAHF